MVSTTAIIDSYLFHLTIGLQFSTFTYYCMSQGLLDPKTLEMIQNRASLDEVAITPSYILREVWQKESWNHNTNRDFHFVEFLFQSLTNLIEQQNKESGKIPIDEELEHYLRNYAFEAGNFHTDWNLTDSNIEQELDRGDQSNVSFYFALRWLTFEI